MALMPKTLELQDYSKAKTFEELKRIANDNNRRIKEAYKKIRNDINFKQWLYFSVGGKKWRIGPDPDGNDFLVQELTGTDWRDQSHWTTKDTIAGT